MVTISANKGDRLRVVADAWHMEGESEFILSFFFLNSSIRPIFYLFLFLHSTFFSFHFTKTSPTPHPPVLGHYEWHISFPPSDVDIGAVHAKFHQDGRLTIDVKRLCYF